MVTNLLHSPRDNHQPTLHLRNSDLELLPLWVSFEIRTGGELLNRFDDGEELSSIGRESSAGSSCGERTLLRELRFEAGDVVEEDLSMRAL